MQSNTIKINNTDMYMLKEESYLNFYNDLLSNKSIFSFFNFLVYCHYFFLDDILQDLPIDFYKYKYEIIEGSFLVQSPDSSLKLPHSIVYKYDEYGNLVIESKCMDENFIGLNYQVNFNYKQCKISNVTIKMKFFERKSKRYDLKFNYEKATITASGESMHSYFTNIVNYFYQTSFN